jgi:hypothetical protein
MGKACDLYEREEKCISCFVGGKSEKKNYLEDLGVVWRILLKWIIKKWHGMAWIGFIWSRVRTSGTVMSLWVSKISGNFLTS